MPKTENPPKRMSLNPSKQPQIPKLNSTELDMKQSNISMSSIMNHEHYLEDDLSKAFIVVSKGSGRIDMSCLAGFLREQGEPAYRATEMIMLLDREKKGWVSQHEFIQFFAQGMYDKQIPLTEQMKKNREWVKIIDENFEEMKEFIDLQYCEYAANKLRRFSEDDDLK